MERTVARFVPAADAGERHSVEVRAPADLVFETAWGFDLESIRLINAIFRLRARLFGLRRCRSCQGGSSSWAPSASRGWEM